MRFFTSDLHLGHANVIGYCQRPFADAAAMNEAILTRWRAAVSPSDEVWVLGDVVLGLDWLSHLATVAALPGRKVLLPGNHDRCWSGNGSRAASFESAYRETFAEILPGPTHTIVEGREVLLAHFPYADPARKEPDRYTKHRPPDDGLPLLCGHVHQHWRRKGHQTNVGVDVWGFFPVAEPVIAKLVGALPRT